MKHLPLISLAVLCVGSLSGNAIALSPSQNSMSLDGQNEMMPPAQSMLPKHADFPPPAPRRPDFSGFPTPEELARLAPPEPLTEAKIRQRFAEQREILQKAIEQDRKRAQKYARDFARYQKYQAQQLADIMAQAEQHRQQMLKRLDQREQRVLQNFRQHKQPAAVTKTQ